MSGTAAPSTKRRVGRFESVVLKLFTRNVKVLDIEDIGSTFRTVTLGGEALRNVEWRPGDKIQIQLGGWVQRTYTPMDWDAENGRTRILVCLHADGLGTRWTRTLRKGDACIVFGPRRSLDLSGCESPVVLFGDETSFGLAAALHDRPEADDAVYVFEASDVAESRLVLKVIDLCQAMLIERTPADAHLAEAEAEMLRLAASEAHFVLTGKASSIQRVNRALKAFGVDSSRVKTKAYWAQGKIGLD
jgi:ferric-chelate reductase (NADPH)